MYAPYYGIYHAFDDPELRADDDPEQRLCSVCVAGGVIAGTLRGDPTRNIGALAYGVEWAAALVALDMIRAGNYRNAYMSTMPLRGRPSAFDHQEFLRDLESSLPPVDRHFVNWEQHEAHMARLEEVAAALAARGL